MTWLASVFCLFSSAKCKSVWKPHADLPDTPDTLNSAATYFQILRSPLGALQCALRLCKNILRCSWKHLQLCRCIQQAMRYHYWDGQTFELLRPLPRSAGDFESTWELSAGLRETSRESETSAPVPRGTWWDILTAVVLRGPQSQGIVFVIFVIVTVTRFPTS